MNAATDTLKKVKTLLGIEVSLEQMKKKNRKLKIQNFN